MNTFQYPPCDRINAPFVLNYLKTQAELVTVFKHFRTALRTHGKLAGLIDMPRSTVHDMRKFGSVKRVHALVEGATIDIELHNGDEQITTLHSIYHPKDVIADALHEAGFAHMVWQRPIVAWEGTVAHGIPFWAEYLANCDVAYFTARK